MKLQPLMSVVYVASRAGGNWIPIKRLPNAFMRCGGNLRMGIAMSIPNEIVHQDERIETIIRSLGGNSAPALFESYRIAGTNRDAFVAALIGRLCVLEARTALEAKRDQIP